MKTKQQRKQSLNEKAAVVVCIVHVHVLYCPDVLMNNESNGLVLKSILFYLVRVSRINDEPIPFLLIIDIETDQIIFVVLLFGLTYYSSTTV